jgi:hypothetical protein
MEKYRLLLTAYIVLCGVLGIAAQTHAPTLKRVTEFDLPGPGGKRFASSWELRSSWS